MRGGKHKDAGAPWVGRWVADVISRGGSDVARDGRVPVSEIPPLPVLCFLVLFVARTESIGVGVGEAFTPATSRPA